MVNTKVKLSGWELDNPVIASSGTFGYGKDFAEIYDLNVLGTFSMKGTTVKPRFGNNQPRIAESDTGLLSSIGLQNPGIDHVLAHELPDIERFFHKKVIANVCGFSVDEFTFLCEKMNSSDKVGIIEVNVSCPNVSTGDMLGSTPENAYAATKAAKNACDKPVYIKLSPNVTDITAIAKACEEGGADGISLINIMKGTRIDLKRRKVITANKLAGYSGRALFPVALGMVYRVYETVKIPIIGIGGVSSAEDVLEMMCAGATAVGVGTANLIDPYACKNIVENLPAAMEKYGVSDIKDLIGAAHD